jgi:two-component system cell cycle response regulator CpdR
MLDKLPRILVADDEDCIRRFLEDICAAEGYAVDMVHEGRAAWSLLSSLNEAYALVFLDICMPGWSGDDVLALLTTLPVRRKFIVVITGALPANLRQEFEEHPNVIRVLIKPFTAADVRQLLSGLAAK